MQPCFITFHYESIYNKEKIKEVINEIKAEGIKAGISIKPNTHIDEIIALLPYVNLVLVMTVEPGLGGQKIIPDTLKKIKELNEYRKKEDLDFSYRHSIFQEKNYIIISARMKLYSEDKEEILTLMNTRRQRRIESLVCLQRTKMS